MITEHLSNYLIGNNGQNGTDQSIGFEIVTVIYIYKLYEIFPYLFIHSVKILLIKD